MPKVTIQRTDDFWWPIQVNVSEEIIKANMVEINGSLMVLYQANGSSDGTVFTRTPFARLEVKEYFVEPMARDYVRIV